MPRIDIVCDNDHVSEVMRALVDYPNTPPCPICHASTVQTHLPPSTRWTIDPVVVFRAPDGEFRFPGDPNGTQVRRYEQAGYERVELRSAADVRRFEHQMNTREYARAQRRVERQVEMRQYADSQRRSEIRRGMEQGFMIPELRRDGEKIVPTGRMINTKLSERTKDVMRAAIAQNDNKPRPRAHSGGFHVEAFSYDRSSREESRDSQGRRRRD